MSSGNPKNCLLCQSGDYRVIFSYDEESKKRNGGSLIPIHEDFIYQEYVRGLDIHSADSGLVYDPVMRFVFGLVRERAQLSFYPLDAYWKLPPMGPKERTKEFLVKKGYRYLLQNFRRKIST